MTRLIYADDAIYELERAFPVEDYGKIIRCISRTQTADVLERKTGNWVGVDDEPCEVWECDRCGYIMECYEDDRTNYCPNCGAQMDERRENAETD